MVANLYGFMITSARDCGGRRLAAPAPASSNPGHSNRDDMAPVLETTLPSPLAAVTLHQAGNCLLESLASCVDLLLRGVAVVGDLTGLLQRRAERWRSRRCRDPGWMAAALLMVAFRAAFVHHARFRIRLRLGGSFQLRDGVLKSAQCGITSCWVAFLLSSTCCAAFSASAKASTELVV